ncbi:MAG TPA: hypothetical protein VGC97_10480 [Pyrinomonadaceae bacterium]
MGLLCVSVVLIFIVSLAIQAQSINQSFPTPVTSNEISGTIKARDLGDARLTTYFYAFNGRQGDVFINVVTKNLDGDIDIFTADNLRPLTKITVYSDNPDSETGRVIYLRQPQRLILRVEGRTPTDDPASYRIKFAGSFEPLAGTTAETDESKQPEVKNNEQTDVRVNSVGTIIEVKPKPTTARVEKEETKRVEEKKEPEKTVVTETAKKDEPEENKADKKPEIVITENLPAKKDEPVSKPEDAVSEKETPKKRTTPRSRKPRTNSAETTAAKTETKPKPTPEKSTDVAPVEPSALENIRLIVDFKDGRKIERPMSEILKFGVDKGILTIIAKDGSIGRYSILDIAKITVE